MGFWSGKSRFCLLLLDLSDCGSGSPCDLRRVDFSVCLAFHLLEWTGDFQVSYAQDWKLEICTSLNLRINDISTVSCVLIWMHEIILHSFRPSLTSFNSFYNFLPKGLLHLVLLAQAAILKYHRLSGLTEIYFLGFGGGCKSNTRVLTWLDSSEFSFWPANGCLFAVPSMADKELWYLLILAPVLLDHGSFNLMTLFNFNHPLKRPYFEYSHTG